MGANLNFVDPAVGAAGPGWAAAINTALANIDAAALVSVRAYGAVGDGVADDTAAFAAASTAAGPTGSLWVAAGTYKLSALPTIATAARSIICAGSGQVTFLHTGSAACLLVQPSSPTTAQAGRLLGCTIDGTSAASASAVGVHLVDTTGFGFDDVVVRNYAGASAVGVELECSAGTCRGIAGGRVALTNNTVGLQLVGGSSTGFAGHTWTGLRLSPGAGQVGLQITGSASVVDGHWNVRCDITGTSGIGFDLAGTSRWSGWLVASVTQSAGTGGIGRRVASGASWTASGVYTSALVDSGVVASPLEVRNGALILVRGARYADVVGYGADPTGAAPAQAAIKAAYDSLTNGGTLRIPGGTYLLTDQLLLSGNRRVKVDTDGTASILLFNAASPLTDGLRIVDAGEFSLGGLRVRNTAGSATVTNLVHYTTTASSQMCALRDLIIDPQATGITNKLAIGHDTFLDVAEVLLENVYCSGLASTGAAVVAGNHTAGNVINIRALSCFFGNAVYGVLIDGSVIQLTNCTMQGNSGADYKVITPGGAPIKIEGVRSEGSKRFFEYTENGEVLGPLSMRDIRVDSFTDTDGHIVWIAGLAVTTLESWTVVGGPVAADFLITSPIAGAVVHARAILTQTQTPFPANANVTVAWDTPHRYINSSDLIAVAP